MTGSTGDETEPCSLIASTEEAKVAAVKVGAALVEADEVDKVVIAFRELAAGIAPPLDNSTGQRLQLSLLVSQ